MEHNKIVNNNIQKIDKALFESILSIRDVIGHGYFRINADILRHMPKEYNREERMKKLGIHEGQNEKQNPISRKIDDTYIADIKLVMKILDEKFFPEISKNIGLDYQKIR